MGTTSARTARRALCALAVAVAVLGACGGAEGGSGPSESSSGNVSEDAAAELETGAPDGKYAASYVLESTNVPGFKPGFESSSTYAFTSGACTDTACSGTVKAPVEGSYEWDGTELVMTFDEVDRTDQCVDAAGQKVEGDTYRMRTEHEARVTPVGDGDDAAAKFEGSYRQATVFSELENGCDPGGPDRQHAEFSLVLERK